MRIGLTIVLLLSINSALYAQTSDEEVASYVDQLDHGKAAEVKSALPDLISKYQNNPGVLYLQGRLATDGVEAVKFYQTVVDNFPKNQWADDALYRIYQYYYAIGLYRTAELKLQQLRKEYPSSTYVTGKAESVPPVQDEPPLKLPTDKSESVTTEHSARPKEIGIPQTTPSSGKYTLQVGAFSTVANAEKQKDFFENLGYEIEITNKVRSGKSLYLVWAGSFATPEEAHKFGKEVKSKYNMDSIVIERY